MQKAGPKVMNSNYKKGDKLDKVLEKSIESKTFLKVEWIILGGHDISFIEAV